MGRVRMGGEWVARARGQGGEALLETLITIAIMAIFITVALTFTVAMTTASGGQQTIVRSSNEVLTASETVDRLTYRPCGTKAQYDADLDAAFAAPAGFEADVTVSGVEYLTGYTSDPNGATPTWSTTACTSASADLGLQRITIRVQLATGTKLGGEVAITKRNSTCPSGISRVGIGC